MTPAQITVGSTRLYFLPDVIFVRDGRACGALNYLDLDISVDTRSILESGPLPGDAKVLGHTWAHVTKSGKPDQRYRNNTRYDIVEYTLVSIRHGSWAISFLVSSAQAAKTFVDSLSDFRGSDPVEQNSTVTPKPVRRAPVLAQPDAEQPVTLISRQNRATSYSITFRISNDGPSSVDPDTIWIPEGREVTVQGFTIPGGLIYVGEGLYGRWHQKEPSLIDPTLPVASTLSSAPAERMDYWPSFAEMTPLHRREFLEWLAAGRQDRAVQIGYVFVFFYGLERRALLDSRTSKRAKEELPVVANEVQRLLAIYGNNDSFRGYATSFLSALQLASSSEKRIYTGSPPRTPPGWEVPAVIDVALGQLAKDGAPLPPDWALRWLRTHPERRLRTPADRCEKEFDELFMVRYVENFGEGLRLNPANKRKRLRYRAASRTIDAIEIPVEVPSILRESATIKKLNSIAERCTNELDGLSRWLGKNPEKSSSIELLAYLPRELSASTCSTEADALERVLRQRFVDSHFPRIGLDDLLRFIEVEKPKRLKKKEMVTLARILDYVGYGMEPDVRFGSPPTGSGQNLILFRCPVDAPETPSEEYRAATVLLHLGAMVATADDYFSAEELGLLLDHVSAGLRLDDRERLRLRAHLEWLILEKPGKAGLTKRLRELDVARREEIARFLISLAAADGRIDPAEVDVLKKIYGLLDLEESSLFSDLHAASIDQESPVQTGASIERPATATVHRDDSSIAIDMDVVRRKRAATAAVSSLLGEIFDEDEPEPTSTPSVPGTKVTGEKLVQGLDVRHSRLFIRLSTQPSWSRAELELASSELDLMVDGALETINELAFDRLGEPVWEGDDPIDLYTDIAGELMQ